MATKSDMKKMMKQSESKDKKQDMAMMKKMSKKKGK